MNTLKTRLLPLSWMLSIPILGLIYPFLNNPARSTHSLVTDLDRSIPFAKIFILPYIGWGFFIFITLIYFGLKDWEIYKKTLVTVDASLLLSYAVFFFYQTRVLRPELAGTDFLSKMVLFVYANDAPFNAFPSIHCLTSYLIIRGIQASSVKNFRNTSIICGSGFTIIISTLFVKQHVLLDVAAAIFLGEIVWLAISKWNEVKINLWIRKLFLSWMTRRKFVI